MNDTSPEIARLVRDRYAAMQPAERFLIGVSLFETARAIVIASFPPDLPDRDLRRRLCERLYPELVDAAFGPWQTGR
ncbi:MAG: hypothetical protein WDZ63_06760 [Burkholderiales bacterium]